MGFGQYSAYGVPRKSKRDMLAAIGEGGISHSRMVARNTMEYVTTDNVRRVRLHDTDVAAFYPDGRIEINTGGWNTMTTRDRINGALAGTAFSVYTHSGQLYVSRDGGKFPMTQRAVLYPNGKVETDIESGEALGYESVRRYVESYMRKLRESGIPEDFSGDPWVSPNAETHKYPRELVLMWIGASPEMHMQDDEQHEPYVFATLIYHALAQSGLTDQGIAYYVQNFNNGNANARRLVCGKVRRYLRACLGYAAS